MSAYAYQEGCFVSSGPSAAIASRLRWHTSSAGNMTANSRAALRGSRAFGVALSYAATAAARSSRRRSLMGIARVFLGCAKAAPVGRGHKHPRSLKKRLCDAVELGDARVCETSRSPALPDVRGPPSPVGFSISRVWVRRAPRPARRESAPRQPASLQYRFASLQGRIEPCARARCRAIARLIMVQRGQG